MRSPRLSAAVSLPITRAPYYRFRRYRPLPPPVVLVARAGFSYPAPACEAISWTRGPPIYLGHKPDQSEGTIAQ
jgi:hypothetical protein